MDTKNLLKIINKELTLLNDIIEGFSPDSNIHPTEIDLALSKTRDLHEELQMLKESIKGKGSESFHLDETSNEPQHLSKNKTERPFENKQEPVEDKILRKSEIKNEEVPEPAKKSIEPEIIKTTEEVEHKQPETVQPVEEKEPAPDNETSGNIQADEPVKPAIVHELKKETIISKPVEKTVKESLPNHSGEIIADRFQNNSPSVNDMLSSSNLNKDLASHFKDRPIQNLKRAIKLNDRIWYIKELFNEDTQLFEQTVDQIDQSSTLDVVLAQLFKQFDWDQNKKSTISFLELIFRRFANQQ